MLSRTANRAVTADDNALALPAAAVKPSNEAIQAAVANPAVGASKNDLLRPTRQLADRFQQILSEQDAMYKRVTARRVAGGCEGG